MLESSNNFRCSAEQFQEFSQSFLWLDMMQELDVWENRLLMELANPTFDVATGQMIMSKNERVLYDEMLRGSLKAIDNMRMLPGIIQGLIEQTKMETNNAKQGSDESDESGFGQ